MATDSHFDSGRAWLVALGAAIASGTAFGTAYTLGTFFDEITLEFEAGRGATALVFGITILLFFGCGVISGPIADKVGTRRLVVVGAVLISAGLYLTSLVDSVVVGYATYGIGVGVGGGMIATPMYASAGAWFRRRRAIAMGVIASGNGLGTIVLVPLADRLIESNGWRDAFVQLAIIDLGLFAVAATLIKRPPALETPPVALDIMRRVSRLPAFRVMAWTSMLFSISLFIAFAFIVDFATDEGITSAAAARLVAIVGAASIVGRLALTTLSEHIGGIRIFQACMLAQPVAFAIWATAGDNYTQLVVFAIAQGIAYGGFVALGPEITAVLFGTNGLGSIMGLVFLAAGIGGLVGPTSAGLLADASSGQTLPITFAIGTSIIAAIIGLRLPTEPIPEFVGPSAAVQEIP